MLLLVDNALVTRQLAVKRGQVETTRGLGLDQVWPTLYWGEVLRSQGRRGP